MVGTRNLLQRYPMDLWAPHFPDSLEGSVAACTSRKACCRLPVQLGKWSSTEVEHLLQPRAALGTDRNGPSPACASHSQMGEGSKI